MTDKELHDIKGALTRLEIMTELLRKQDFRSFSKEEIKQDAAAELEKLRRLLVDAQ